MPGNIILTEMIVVNILENKKGSDINNIEIKADKGAIVQTGSDQIISNVNNDKREPSWQDNLPLYFTITVVAALIAMIIFWYLTRR